MPGPRRAWTLWASELTGVSCGALAGIAGGAGFTYVENDFVGMEVRLQSRDRDTLDGDVVVDGEAGGDAGGLAHDHVLRLHAQG